VTNRKGNRLAIHLLICCAGRGKRKKRGKRKHYPHLISEGLEKETSFSEERSPLAYVPPPRRGGEGLINSSFLKKKEVTFNALISNERKKRRENRNIHSVLIHQRKGEEKKKTRRPPLLHQPGRGKRGENTSTLLT